MVVLSSAAPAAALRAHLPDAKARRKTTRRDWRVFLTTAFSLIGLRRNILLAKQNKIRQN